MWLPMFIWLPFLIPDFERALELEINEDSAKGEDIYLTVPNDAVYHEGNVYIADDSYSVLVFSKSGRVERIGRKGEGPGEFSHWPQNIDIVDDVVVATDFFRLRRRFFTTTGRFLRHEDIDRQIIEKENHFRELSLQEAMETGYRYHFIDGDWDLGYLEQDSDKGYHLADSLIRVTEKKIFVIRKRGAIDVYNRAGTLQQSLPMNLEAFKAELDVSLMYKMMTANKPTHGGLKPYVLGTPIYDAALDAHGNAWLLVSNEHVAIEQDNYRPKESWLFVLNLQTGSFAWSLKMPRPVSRVRICDQHLLLISSEDAFVQVYSLAAFKELGENQ